MSKGNLIDGQWNRGSGEPFKSLSPATGAVVWEGMSTSSNDVGHAFRAARKALQAWRELAVDERIVFAKKFQTVVLNNADEFAETISTEMGKPLWEAKTEVAAVSGKVDLAIDALKTRRDTTVSEVKGMRAVTRYRPHGVMGVLGPFNLPAHLPNGHIVPAILAGNTVVFKPSEQTPLIAELMMEYWEKAGIPAGVVNLVQGAKETGTAITRHHELDGLLFTGSSRAGIAINQALAAEPQKIVALEMGGNNPLLLHRCKDLRAAAYQTVLSAYITSGQRCTCARRLILVAGDESKQFIAELTNFISKIKVGYFSDEPEPFFGPVISREMGSGIQQSQRELIAAGAKPLVELKPVLGNDALLSPGLVDISEVENVQDEEIFGPLLQLTRVNSFEQAIEKANDTKYGLSAGLLSDDRDCYELFISKIRAGVVNWNRQTTGASGKLPFGGCGLSGNHRPSGYFAADYCSYPVASLESDTIELPPTLLNGFLE